MERASIRGAVVSTDTEFTALVAQVVHRIDRGIGMGLQISVPLNQIGDEQVTALRDADPELVFLDIEHDPALGLRFAQFLADQSPSRRILAAGPPLPADMLLAAMRAGIAEYLPKPLSADALQEALEVQLRKIRRAPVTVPAEPGQLLAVFSLKGGSGCTTLATNLAIQLHRLTGKSTLLVDLDVELGEIAIQLGVEPPFNLIDMVRNFHRMDADLLASFIEHHSTGVHVLSAPYHPERAESVNADQIARILQFLRQHYEYVVVDTSKSFSAATLATLEQADQIYLVTVADLPSLRNITRCLPLLRQVPGRSEDQPRVVINRYHADGVIKVEDVERTLGLKVFATIANDYDAVMSAINTGSPIALNGFSRYAADLNEMTARIAGVRPEVDASRRGLARMVDPLTRILRRAAPKAADKAPATASNQAPAKAPAPKVAG